MYLKKTVFGGWFSIIFVLAAVVIISISTFQYQLLNVKESKTLLPLAILDTMIPVMESFMSIELEFISYGGTCSSDFIETGIFKIQLVNIDNQGLSISCYKSDNDCKVLLVCRQCIV